MTVFTTDSVRLLGRNGPDRRYACGHIYSERYTLLVYGEEIWSNSSQTDAVCAECLKEEFNRGTQCACCGRFILPGQWVVLYPWHALHSLGWLLWGETVGWINSGSRRYVLGCARKACNRYDLVPAGMLTEDLGLHAFVGEERLDEGHERLPSARFRLRRTEPLGDA